MAPSPSQPVRKKILGAFRKPRKELVAPATATMEPKQIDPRPATEFSYVGLDKERNEIRLLVLHCGIGDEPISCDLVQGPLERDADVLQYEALSYTWGQPPDSNEIHIGGVPFPVRPNLHLALKHLRYEDQDRVLWVDAICINQRDGTERNHQVSYMGDIFRQATCVNVWLGVELDSTRVALKFLRAFADLDRQAFLNLGPRERSRFVHERAPWGTEWPSLNNETRRAYWKRVWIVQEIVLASEITMIVESSQISWCCLTNLLFCLENVRPDDITEEARIFRQSKPARLQSARDNHRSGGTHLRSLLLDFQDTLCTLDHDRVYGFLGLATDYYRDSFAIDYTKSVYEVHRDVVLSYARKEYTSKNCKIEDIYGFAVLLCKLLRCNHHHYPGLDRLPTLRITLYSTDTAFAMITHTSYVRRNRGLSVNKDWVRTILPLEQHLKGYHRMIVEAEASLFPCGHDSTILEIHDASYATIIRPAPNQPVCGPPMLPNSKKTPSIDWQPGRYFWSSDGYLGIVPHRTKCGDFLYKIPKSNTFLVVSTSPSLRILGTACVLSSPWFAQYGSKPPLPAQASPILNFFIDMTSLQAMVQRESFVPRPSAAEPAIAPHSAETSTPQTDNWPRDANGKKILR